MLSEIIKKEGKVQKVTAKKKRFRHRASFFSESAFIERSSFHIYGTSARQLWQQTAVENPVRPSNLLIGTITYAHRIFWRTIIVSLRFISLFYIAFAWLRFVITQSFIKTNTDYSNFFLQFYARSPPGSIHKHKKWCAL